MMISAKNIFASFSLVALTAFAFEASAQDSEGRPIVNLENPNDVNVGAWVEGTIGGAHNFSSPFEEVGIDCAVGFNGNYSSRNVSCTVTTSSWFHNGEQISYYPRTISCYSWSKATVDTLANLNDDSKVRIYISYGNCAFGDVTVSSRFDPKR